VMAKKAIGGLVQPSTAKQSAKGTKKGKKKGLKGFSGVVRY
jgi:hypothetical protein